MTKHAGTAIVVGGSSGVGRATVLGLAAHGTARLGGRPRPRAAGPVEPRGDRRRREVLTRAFDATDGAAMDRLIDEADPDLLVLSAGARPRLAPVAGTDLGELFGALEHRPQDRLPGRADGAPPAAASRQPGDHRLQRRGPGRLTDVRRLCGRETHADVPGGRPAKSRRRGQAGNPVSGAGAEAGSRPVRAGRRRGRLPMPNWVASRRRSSWNGSAHR